MKSLDHKVQDLLEAVEALQTTVASQRESIENLTRCVERLSWPHRVQPSPVIVPKPVPGPGVTSGMQELIDGVIKGKGAPKMDNPEFSKDPRPKLGT